MASILDVVNECLATLGETPLNTLNEPHEFKSSAQRKLTRIMAKTQARSWWFNVEAITLNPAPLTGFVTLPGDCLKWQSGVRSKDLMVRSQAKPWLVQRGLRLYDTRNRTYTITESVTGEITRLIPFDELPQVINDLIAAETVLAFQSDYDADNNKRQELKENLKYCLIEANSENIRQLAVNMLDNNPRLARIKNVSRRYN